MAEANHIVNLPGEASRDTGCNAPALPSFVRTEAELVRWELSVAIAVQLTGESSTSEAVWFAARSVYNSDIPT